MNSLPKVLVVDGGRRVAEDLLSTELAELGFSSVTTSVEAADEVLELIAPPSAIFLNMASGPTGDEQIEFARLAEQLKAKPRTSGVPVIVWNRELARQAGGISAILRSEAGLQEWAAPEI